MKIYLKYFRKDEKDSLKYWFSHWCAFQMIALVCRVWRPVYLLHDLDKVVLRKIFKRSESEVKRIHREYSRHHLEYKGKKGIDYVSIVLDWESSGLTKYEKPKTAREKFDELIYNGVLTIEQKQELRKALEITGLWSSSIKIRNYVN